MTPWLSLHIFHGGDLDALLADAIAPALRRLTAAHAIDRAFFIRYWNGGPHIRLRVRPAIDEQRVLAALRDEVEPYLVAYRTPADAATYHALAAEMTRAQKRMRERAPLHVEEVPEPLQPEGSMQRRAYVFDAPRYGGARAALATEAHFCDAAELALAVVAGTRARPVVRHSMAMQFAAVTAAAIEEQGGDAAAIFHAAARIADDLEIRFDRDEHLPSTAQENLVAELLASARARRELQGQSQLANAMLQLWRESLRRTAERLEPIATTMPIAALFVDYLHLFHNRIGITIADECRIYSLLARAAAPALASRGEGR